MREMEDRLGEDPELAAAYAARARGLPRRPRPSSATCRRSTGVSAGGMPDRVKCLHVLAAPGARRRAGRQPARRRGARRGSATGGPPGPCVERRDAERRDPASPPIDCGTNSIKLLIGDLPARSPVARAADGPARPGRRPHRPARRRGAGADVRRRRRVRRADRARHGVDAGPLLRHLGDPRRRATPTSSPTGVRERLGVDAGGAVAATRRRRWSSTARSAHLRDAAGRPGARRRHRRRLDRAGRSATDRRRRRPRSMDIGSVRLHERHLHADPPTARRRSRPASPTSTRTSTPCPVAARPTRGPVVGTSGTVKTAGGRRARPAGLRPRRDRPGACLGAGRDRAYVERLVAMTVAERRALPVMHPGRADVIGAGALILDRVLRRARVSTLPGLRGRHPRRHRLVAGRTTRDRPAPAPGHRAAVRQPGPARAPAGPTTRPTADDPGRAHARRRTPAGRHRRPRRARGAGSACARPARGWCAGARTWPATSARRSPTSPTGAGRSPAGARRPPGSARRGS